MASNFNWIDIIMACIVVRSVLIGLKSSITIEVFRFIGIICAIFITLHYYVNLGNFFHKNAFIPTTIDEIAAFVVLWLTVFFVFKLIGEGWALILKIEVHPLINRWGVLVLSLFRSVLVCALTFMLLFVSNNVYLGKMSNRAFTGQFLIDISPRIYDFIYKGIVRKYFPDENLNVKVFVLRSLGREKSTRKKK